MEPNTTQGGAQQGGGQPINPLYDTTQGQQGAAQGGGNPPVDDTGATPPWLSFSPTGTSQEDPAADPFGTGAFTDSAAVQQAPGNPWETPASAPAEPAANPWDSATVPETSAPSNPWETIQEETPVEPVQNPWDAPVQEETAAEETAPWENTASTEEDTGSDDSSAIFADSTSPRKSSDDLLFELKRRFEEEEAEIDQEIQIHEENIKLEQSAIRELKASRKEQIEKMRGMFQELKVILKLDKPEEAPQNKPRPQHPQPKQHTPRPQQSHPQAQQKERTPQQRAPQQNNNK